jgi:hypothetical protein
MAIFSVKVITDGFSYLAKAYPEEASKEFGNAAWQTLVRFRDIFIRMRLSGRPGLNRITGQLIRSFKVGRSPRGVPIDRVRAWLASGSPYARIHEEGGVIRPKRAQALAIPIGPARTKAGATKGGYESPRNHNDLEFIKRGHGRAPILARVTKTRVTPMFVLVKSVTIKPRLKFHDTWGRWIQRPAAMRFFSIALTRLVNTIEEKGKRGSK